MTSRCLWQRKVRTNCMHQAEPKYNGSAKDLIPTLNLIHIRWQNEAWYSATVLPLADRKTIDLVQWFSQVTKADVETRVKTIWDSPTIETDRHTRGTPAYNARLFGVFLINSITNDFLTMLSAIQPDLTSLQCRWSSPASCHVYSHTPKSHSFCRVNQKQNKVNNNSGVQRWCT